MWAIRYAQEHLVLVRPFPQVSISLLIWPLANKLNQFSQLISEITLSQPKSVLGSQARKTGHFLFL